jgi:hypothetical protein
MKTVTCQLCFKDCSWSELADAEKSGYKIDVCRTCDKKDKEAAARLQRKSGGSFKSF